MESLDAVVDEIAPADIDTGFAPRPVPGLLEVPVESDLVVIDPEEQRAHVLNPTAALLWQVFDGEFTLEEMIGEISAGSPVPEEEIRADVLSLTRELGRAGLLDGVYEPEDPEDAQVFWGEPDPLAEGAEFEPFRLPDLHGTEMALEAYRGRRVLLVNWSPDCGFCSKIAGTLSELQDPLAEQGVDMIFVTSGTADQNELIFSEAGMKVPVLLKQEDMDPFAGFGTPVAYLLDQEGRVAVPMAHGADQVPKLAARLAGVNAEADSEAGPRQEVRYLPAVGGVCGPGGGTSTSTSWEGLRAYRMGDFHVGLRYNSEETADVLDRLFGGQRVEDADAPDNYSVALYPAKGRGARQLNLLVRGGQQLVRSRSRARVLSALLARLSAELVPWDPTLLHVNATAAVRGGEALLLPPGLLRWVKELQPRLASLGIQVVDAPPSLDPSSGELVVPEPAIAHDPTVLAEADHGVRLGSELPAVRPGRYPLTTWYVVSRDEQVGPLSRAFGVASAIHLIQAINELEWAAERLPAIFERTGAYALWYESAEELVGQIAGATG